jgi:hypothetical protein
VSGDELPPWLDRVLACGEHQELGRDPSCEDCREVVGATAYLFDLMAGHERVWTASHLRRLARIMEYNS